MNIEKAIEILQNYSPCSQENLYQVHQVAISALERQIPKQVNEIEQIEKYVNISDGYCPKCIEYVTSKEIYCSSCGQQLSWEVENE